MIDLSPVWLIVAALLGILTWWLVARSRRATHPVSGGLQQKISLPHEQEVELYSNAFSHCSRKTRLVLAELGISHKHHAIDLIETGWYQTISPAYLKVNPAGLVPTLVHAGHPVFESDDILVYAQSLANQGAPKLYPEDPQERAKVDAWLAFCNIDSAAPLSGMATKAGACIPPLTLPMFVAAIQYIPLRHILVGFLFHPDKKRPALFTAAKIMGYKLLSKAPAARLLRPARKHMLTHLESIDRALGEHGGPWMIGQAFSLADVTVGCLLLRLDETGWLQHFTQQKDLSRLLDYYDRLKDRDAWQEAIVATSHPIIEQAQLDLKAASERDVVLQNSIYVN